MKLGQLLRRAGQTLRRPQPRPAGAGPAGHPQPGQAQATPAAIVPPGFEQPHILHLLHNDKFSQPFVEFIQRNFGPQAHRFVFFGGYPETLFQVPRTPGVWLVPDDSHFPTLELLLKKAQKVFLHGLFINNTMAFLSRPEVSLNHAYWISWGGDMQADVLRPDTELFRQRLAITRKLEGMLFVVPEDCRVAQKIYGFTGPCGVALYKNPMSREILDRFRGRQAAAPPIIQINNSADESALEVLEILSRFGPNRFRVRCVLSYGYDDVKPKIIALGKRAFGENFLPLTDYLAPEKYAEVLSETSVAIMNQRRQQGMGNIYAWLYQGAKLYLRSDVPTWPYLRGLGFELFDTLNLAQEPLESLLHFDAATAKHNHQIASRFFDEDYLASNWRQLFSF